MNVISEEYMEADSYVIAIKNFRKKLREANVGEVASTKKFMVDESRFTIDLYIAGDEDNNGGHLSLFLTNQSTWKVRAATEVSVIVSNYPMRSVKKFLLFSDGPDGEIFQSEKADKPERSLGWSKCVPHSRCFNNDYLSYNGVLTLKVKVHVLAGFAEAQLSDIIKRFPFPTQDQERSRSPRFIKQADKEPPASSANEEMKEDLENQLAAIDEATKIKLAAMEETNQKHLEALERDCREKLSALEKDYQEKLRALELKQMAELSDVRAKLLNVENELVTVKENLNSDRPDVESKINKSQHIRFNIRYFRARFSAMDSSNDHPNDL